jgi:hypothetical protein
LLFKIFFGWKYIKIIYIFYFLKIIFDISNKNDLKIKINKNSNLNEMVFGM